ncbi:unnamed protein product [Adineta ricciae]|uniref:Uncharacterized protein n=1 Tax=Adineta ricciae TaxID=249248 RepID=A0A814L4Z1_ADIRI|nr:unnamed protein product [Adineta ricciae]CAF1382781.1 unnamed protein product [Adineta ricciae]
MIFLMENILQLKTYFNESINQIYIFFQQKTFSKKIFHEFSSKSLSTIFHNSKLSIMKSFGEIYHLREFNELIPNISENFNSLNSSLSKIENFKTFFKEFTKSFDDFFNLNGKFCSMMDKNNENEMKKYFLEIISSIENEMKFFVEIFNEQILKKINWTFFHENLRQQVHFIFSFISTLSLILISLILFLPSFFIWIFTLNSLCFQSNSKSDLHQLQTISYERQRYSTHQHRNHRSKRQIRKRNANRSYSLTLNNFVRGKSSKISSSYCLICSIRISFTILFISSIILLLISSIFFALDMFFQSSCHLIHEKQHVLISYITENFLKSIDEFNVNSTLTNLIDDCRNEKHFSQRYLEKFSIEFKDEFSPMLKKFNEKIYKQFQKSKEIQSISSNIELIRNFIHLIPSENLQNRFYSIEKTFRQVQLLFQQILQENSHLSKNFLTKTFHQLEIFFENLIESNLDSCPLPIFDLMKLDESICHRTLEKVNGLWFKILFFIFSNLIFLCIFAFYLFKKIF